LTGQIGHGYSPLSGEKEVMHDAGHGLKRLNMAGENFCNDFQASAFFRPYYPSLYMKKQWVVWDKYI
jgi:hypothetical protein